jgi:hypothetical protein
MKIRANLVVSPALSRKIDKALGEFTEDVMSDFTQAARNRTPVDTGAAQAAWRFNANGEKSTATNRKPYIKRLDENWSKQTRGKGIVKPAIRDVNRKYKR